MFLFFSGDGGSYLEKGLSVNRQRSPHPQSLSHNNQVLPWLVEKSVQKKAAHTLGKSSEIICRVTKRELLRQILRGSVIEAGKDIRMTIASDRLDDPLVLVVSLGQAHGDIGASRKTDSRMKKTFARGRG